MQKVTAHLTQETLDACNARGSISGALNRITARYVEACRGEDIEAEFSSAELDAIRVALSWWWGRDKPASVIAGGFVVEVEDALLAGLAVGYEIDGAALMAKLRRLTYIQNLALIDAVERYWHGVSAAHAGGDE